MAEDTLTLTIRLHDPREKDDADKSTRWAVIQVPREDFALGASAFLEKHVYPALTHVTERHREAKQ